MLLFLHPTIIDYSNLNILWNCPDVPCNFPLQMLMMHKLHGDKCANMIKFSILWKLKWYGLHVKEVIIQTRYFLSDPHASVIYKLNDTVLHDEVSWSSKRDEDEITYRRRGAISLRAGGRKQGDVLLRKPEDIPFPNCPLNLVSDGSPDCWCAGKITVEDSDWMKCLECAHPKAWPVELCGLKWKVTTLIGRSQGPYTVVIIRWPWLVCLSL